MPPTSKRLLLGKLLLAAAAVLFVLTFMSLNRGAALGEQYKAQGSFTVQTEDAGRHYLWNNYKTVFDGRRIEQSSKFPRQRTKD